MRHDHSRADANGEIEYDGESERSGHDAEVAARSAPKFHKGVRFGHAHRYGEQNGAESGKRNVTNEWRGDECDEEKQ